MHIYLDYAKGLNAREEIILWVKSVLKNKLAREKMNGFKIIFPIIHSIKLGQYLPLYELHSGQQYSKFSYSHSRCGNLSLGL